MYIKNHNIEFSKTEWKVIREILDDFSESYHTADSMFKAVFAVHGRFDDKTRNGFLCPLMDRLKAMGTEEITVEIQYGIT